MSSASESNYAGLRLDRVRAGSGAPGRLGIGFDFGTSNSAVAVFDGDAISVVRLEEPAAIMPSACYIDRSFSVETGERAIREYIEGNQGRRVELAAEVLGEARMSTGAIDEGTGLPSTAGTDLVFGREQDDTGLPGRLFLGVKRLLGSKDNERIAVFGRPYRLVALVTPILSRMNAGTSRAAGAADHGCIGHPVEFEGKASDHNRIALERLAEAYRHAGVAEQRFCPEPIAAALGYLHAHALDDNCRMLSVDFGGGTLDLCLIVRRGARLEVEAVHGIALGGNRIDQTVFRELVFPLLGKGEPWSRTIDGRRFESPFPFWRYEDLLLNWQVSYLLNQNEFTAPIRDQIEAGGDRARKFLRLYHLIAQNFSFEVFRAIQRAKEQLSSEPEVVLDIPEIDVDVRIERRQFESMIAGLLAEFDDAVVEILRRAKLDPRDVDVVLRTGGSALIPAFVEILDGHFPGRVVEHDPFTGVASGLAIADYHGIGKIRDSDPISPRNWGQ